MICLFDSYHPIIANFFLFATLVSFDNADHTTVQHASRESWFVH